MIETDSPELYKKVKPEVKIIHETYFMSDNDEIKRYTIQTFCVREGITVDRLKESLKLYEAALAGIQGTTTTTTTTTTIHWHLSQYPIHLPLSSSLLYPLTLNS